MSFNLGELQKSIDYVRENFDNWASMPIQGEIDLQDNSVMVTEFNSAYIPEDEDVFVLASNGME